MNTDTFPSFAGYQFIESTYNGRRTLVYRGIQTVNNQPVIVKFLRSQYPTFSELVQFRNQYAIARNLDIAGIVRPISLEPWKNGYALIMEDCGSVSLQQYAQYQPLGIEDVLNIAVQLAQILHELHQNRVIHKDIKPANILIHPETQKVKLIDFSISSLLPKETQEIQNPNVLEGTLAYISPEQTGRMNRGIDYRSDFYSLGITLYELLTGILPFQSDDPMELVHCHIAKVPLELGNREDISEVISDIVLKLMAKNAEDRYQSALGLKYDLEKCLSQYSQTQDIERFELGKRDICDRFIIPEKLYGREREVQALLDAFERVSGQQPDQPNKEQITADKPQREMMLVAGFSGIGKTAVINEVHKPIVRQRGYFIKGKFDQFNRNIPFSAFVSAFRDLIGQLLSESETQLKAWKDKILEALGDQAQVLIDVIPELEGIIGQQPAAAELSGTAAQNRFNLLFSKFIQVFTRVEHPLVLFLDDLQWADSASLNLLNLLTSESEIGYLLVLGAYRDNEVDPAHPLMLTLDEIEKQQAIINTITLAPLTQSGLNHLIADTLSCSFELAFPLTELVYQKTQGNPFFATQFLKGLHEDGEITFNFNIGYWQCDIVRIRQLSLTDDVVEFMATQLQKLPSETQQILKLAGAIGNQFDLQTLAIVSEQSLEDTATVLWRALQEGLVLPTNEVYKFYQSENNADSLSKVEGQLSSYRFLHDRVQQAAYSLMTQEQKQMTHLDIGTLLLEKLSTTEQEDRIFEIVNHLNIGRTLVTQPSSKREELTQLNLVAGRKAKASTAYAGAFTYIKAGMELLPDDCWQNHYELSIALYTERIEVEYLNGNFDQAEIWIERTLEKAKTPMEKVKIYNLSIVQYTLQAKYSEALQAGRKALALINIKLPEEEFDRVRDAELAITEETLKNRSFSSLSELPLMTQVEPKMAIKLLITMGPPAYRSHQRLWSVICAKAINLCLKYGNTPEVGYIYPAFGGLRGYALNNYQGTHELLDVTIQLTQNFNNKSAQSVAYLMIGSSLRHWSHPLKVATEDYLSSYRVGLESSNLQYAAYAFGHNMYCRFYQSIHLEKLVDEISTSLAFSHKYKNQWAIDLLFGGRSIIAELLGKNSDSLEKLVIADESDYLQQCRDRKNWQVICIYNILKTQFLFLCDQPDEALEYGKQADAEIINVAPQGLLPYARHVFIYSLLLASLYPNTPESQKLDNWEKISTYQKQLEIWAQNCPENFLHLYCLVNAEIARVSGNFLEAIELYDRAIAAAKENEYLHEVALANELAAKFYLNWGKEKIAQTYMIEAYYCYARWGAKAKTEQLEQTYPQLLTQILQQPQSSLPFNASISLTSDQTLHTSTSANTSVLDISAAIKASQTLSGEIELEALLTQLMQIVQENAGADQAALILNNAETWEVVAQCQEQNCQLSPTSIEKIDTLPLSIVCTVQRTEKTIIINQVQKDKRFASDSYLIRQKPKSLFCTPILNQGRLIGILYLENSLSTEAFTTERVEVLNLLCSQAAISLENARLYRQSIDYAKQLEGTVQELQHTQQQLQNSFEELQAAQLQLVQSEKMSALGNLVAGVAHEINNPLGFINGNIAELFTSIQDITEYINCYENTFPSPGEEIENKREQLDIEFLLEDLPNMLSAMKVGCDRIGGISTSLRTFSRADTHSKFKANLHDGIDSTLLILKYRLKAKEIRPEIEIIRNYGNIPEINCFPGQLNQVLMNILANAIDMFDEMAQEQSYQKLSAHPQQIIIRTHLIEQHTVEISISDNGKGMSEEVSSKVFDRKFTTKEVGKGTGLGLAIARQIIAQKHNGSLKVNSQIGQGTEFVISLPI